MKTVNDNYPKSHAEISDEQLKQFAVQQMQQQQARKSNFPTEVISLPSKGILYPETSPLASGTIEMKYMTAREEDILTSQNLIRQGIVLDKLFQSMIVSPIDYNELVIGDKNAIMIAARVLGYGKDYPIDATCPMCERSSEHHIDLTTLKEKNVKIDDDVRMVAPNQFEIMLPNAQRVVTFQLITHGIDAKIEKKLEQAKKTAKKDSVDNELTTRLKHLIVAVDGETSQAYIDNFVDNELFALDSRVLRAKLKDVAPDVPLDFNFECPHCGHSEQLDFPITTNFFWPGA